MPSTKTTPTARRTSRRLSFAPEPTNERRTSARLRTPTVGLKLQDDNVQASPDIPTDTPTNRRRSSRRSLVSQAPLVPKLKEEGNLPMPIPKLKLKKCVVNMGSPCKVKEYWSSSEDFKENSTTVDKNKKIKRKRSREVSSKSNLSLEFISDQDAEEITDIKKISSKTISSDEDKDEALDYCGKYRRAKEKLDQRRGEIKGSQVFGFKTPAAKRGPLKIVKINEKGNADAYFDGQAHHIETSDATLARLKTPKLSQEQIDELLADQPLKHQGRIQTLLRDYRSKFGTWMRLLRSNFNLVLFGLGSKKGLLREFQMEMLAEADCLVINGFFPSLTLKSILNAITDDILEAEGESFGTFTDQVNFIRTTMDARTEPLYLMVNNIDGPMLRQEKAQGLLSQLSSHPNIFMICSIDHINAPLIWDHHKLTKFNFVWFDTTTFLPYREETRYENSFMVTQSGALELNSLIHVFASLNQNAKAIYMKIVDYQIESADDDGNELNKNYEGMSFQDLYQKCRNAFLVNSDLTLRAQLTEYKDHKLVTVKRHPDGIDYLTIPLLQKTLLEFKEIQDS